MICSLGTLCFSSALIKSNNLKNCSYPFDWIFSNPNMIIDCIEDGFKIFLDKSYYININDTSCGHSMYHPTMFFHRNPLIKEDDYNYYVRCVGRFKDLLSNLNTKLFIITFHNNTEIHSKHKQDILSFNERLKQYTSNYKLLVIYHLKTKKCLYHSFSKDDNIDFLELHTIGTSDGEKFRQRIDIRYINEIFTNYITTVFENPL